MKILSCTPDNAESGDATPGTVLALSGGSGAGVVTGDGLLRLDEVALEGSRAMTIQQFLAGHRSFLGAKLIGRASKDVVS